jgi:hypothetical protein
MRERAHKAPVLRPETPATVRTSEHRRGVFERRGERSGTTRASGRTRAQADGHHGNTSVVGPASTGRGHGLNCGWEAARDRTTGMRADALPSSSERSAARRPAEPQAPRRLRGTWDVTLAPGRPAIVRCARPARAATRPHPTTSELDERLGGTTMIGPCPTRPGPTASTLNVKPPMCGRLRGASDGTRTRRPSGPQPERPGVARCSLADAVVRKREAAVSRANPSPPASGRV